MPHLPFLDDVALIAALGVAVTFVLSKLRLPAVTGLLLTGALVGPSGFGWVKSPEAIEVLAELGVVFLLFSVGLEFSIERLATVFRQVALGGLLQIGLTMAASVAIALLLGQSPASAFFLGCVFALSSTAIVLRALTERRELEAPHGRFVVGALVLQDLCVVPMVIVIPLLGGNGEVSIPVAVVVALLKAVGVVLAILVVSRMLVPKLLDGVDASRSREAFLLAILALCLGASWLTGRAGLSLALGAFLSGVVIAGTSYGHRAMSEVIPLRDTFASLFFVSLGTFFSVAVVMSEPAVVLGLTFSFVVGKGVLATLAALVMRFPARVAWLAGVGLAQFGEFGFVLISLGQQAGLVTVEAMSPLLSAGIISMFLTPVLVRLAPRTRAGERLLAPLERLLGVRSGHEPHRKEPKSGHVLVVGYGLAGRTLCEALKRCGLPFEVLELNAEVVRQAQALGEPLTYADATSPEALDHAGVSTAKTVVLLVNDAEAARRIVVTLARVAPAVPILMRARFLAEIPSLKALGAREVIAEELEAGLEVVVRVLRLLEQPKNIIEARVREIRRATELSDRKVTARRPSFGNLSALASLKIEVVQVELGSEAVGRSTLELDVRRRSGATVVALARNGRLEEPFSPALVWAEGDTVFLVGAGEQLQAAAELFTAARVPAER